MGVLAAAAGILDITSDLRTYNLGIFNCRRVAGGLTWSLHAEGRALDLGWSSATTQGQKQEALERFVGFPELGIQRVIANRVLYDRQTPEGRPYFGEDPHVGHAHIEWCWRAALSLTPSIVARILHTQLEDDTLPVIIGRLADPKDSMRWLLFAGKRIGLNNWTNVQALMDKGAATILLSDEQLAQIPQIL